MSIDCRGKHIFSGGTFSRILFHDLQTGDAGSFSGSLARKVRTHPTNPEIFMATLSRTFDRKSCARLYDVRVGKHTADIVPEHLGGERSGPYIEGLAINPVDPNYFLVGDDDCVPDV